jgi:zinc transporter
MALCVFDISADGSATIPADMRLAGDARYRWWHFDMADPELASWAAAHLPAVPAGALLQPETRPRCDRYDDGLILNLRGINLNKGQAPEEMVSVRLWVTDKVIITVRLRKIFALEEIHKDAAAELAPSTPAAFVTKLVSILTMRAQEEVLSITRLTEFFEADLDDDATPPPKELPLTRRRVIRLRRYLEPQRAALVKLASTELDLFPLPDRLNLREYANRTTIAVEELDAQRERLIAVQDDHDLDVARRQARHSHLLSIVAAVFLPIGFLTGLFGVNLAGIPGTESHWAFAALCLVLGGIALLMIGFMRLSRWI